ncbi:M3 family metallopeptidase [Pseudomonas aegrilactucae]|uniref:Peptidase M3 n=1 Tax=Pseudomonas aegrilactucae TaxID=2854028 RepID=A0A9Q3AD09_9PSED|nr:M3 family metallopeptidase [Pseudomonas aegrilactucae]MBV6288167.1 peptidase M3 [Pseudomonas aegrilactucae]
MSANPLLARLDPPPYASIRLEHLTAAIDQIILDNHHALAELIVSQSVLPTWDDLVMAVDALDARLNNAVRLIVPLYTRGEAWKSAVDECWIKSQAYHQAKLQNVTLLALYQRLADSAHAAHFSRERTLSLQQSIKAFRLSGAELGETERARLMDLQVSLSKQRNAFVDNLAHATGAWTLLVTDAQRLLGVDELDKAAMARKAQAQGLEGWLVTLEEAPCLAILQQASDRSLRETVYRAYHGRASDLDAGPDNGPVLLALSRLRHEQAQLLGFASFAELSLQTKTAESTTQVAQFLQDLTIHSAAWRAGEIRRLHAVDQQARLGGLQPWDIAFYARRAQHHPLALSSEEVRGYFPLEQVLQAMRQLAQTLFGVQLTPASALQAWHADVRCFEVVQGHALVGYLYMDVVTRPGKDDYAWSLRVWNRHVDAEGGFHKGVAALFCAVERGDGVVPPLLTHLDLRKLYHEFGHCLHQLLVATTDYRLSDIDTLGPDGVEFFSELLERWCWSAQYLAGISHHYQTGQALPSSTVQAFLDQQKLQEGLTFARDLARARFDLHLHGEPDVSRSLQQQVAEHFDAVLPLPLGDFERPAQAFDHLVSGYEAGYYSYLWSRVYAIDAFARFEREGVLNPETGRALLEAIVAPGAGRTITAGFRAFRGRDVSPLPFLQWHGMSH